MNTAFCMDQSVRLESIVSKMPPANRSTCRSMLQSVWNFIILDGNDHVIYPSKGWIKGSHIVDLLNCMLDGDRDRTEDCMFFASLLIRSVHVS